MVRTQIIPYNCISEIISDKNYEVVVKLSKPVKLTTGLLPTGEYFTYDMKKEAPIVEVDDSFQVTLYFGKNKRLRRKLLKQFENDHI